MAFQVLPFVVSSSAGVVGSGASFSLAQVGDATQEDQLFWVRMPTTSTVLSTSAEAGALGVTEISIPYAGDPVIPAGAALFALACTLFNLGIHAATGAPDGTNAAAWATSIAS